MAREETHGVESVPLVGRTAELAALQTAAADTCARGARLVLVRGGPGIGKTSLLTMAGAELAGSGVVLRASGHGDAVPYRTVRDLIGGLPGAWPLLSEADSGDYATLENLARITIGVLNERPATLLVDDADQCDELSLRWLSFLFRRAASLPLLLVLGMQPGDSDRGRPLTALTGSSAATSLELGPFGRADIAILVTGLLGQPDPAFLDACRALTGGHPRTLRALLDALRSHGVRPDHASARRVGEIGGAVLAQGAVGWLRGQPDPVQRVAAGLAISGPADSQVLGSLLGLSTIAVDTAIAKLRRRGILAPERVAFTHSAVRLAVAGELPPGELRTLRVRSARILQDNGQSPRDVARLLAQLDTLDEPWMYATLWDAAADAARAGDPAEAARFLTRALADSRDDVPATIALATALAAHEPESAMTYLFEAVDRAEQPATRVAAVARLVEAAQSAPPNSALFRVFTEVVDAVLPARYGPHDIADPGLRARAEAAAFAAGLGDGETVGPALERANRIVPPDSTTPANRSLLGELAAAEMLDRRPAREVLRLARAAVYAPTATLRLDEGVIAAAAALHFAGQAGEALSAVSNAIANTGPATTLWLRCHARSLQSTILLDIGDIHAAEADSAAAAELASGQRWALPRFAAARVLAMRGEYGAAARELPDPDRVPMSFWEKHLRLLLKAELSCAQGDPDSALPHLVQWRGDSELDRTNPLHVVHWPRIAMAFADRGDQAAAEELAEPQLAVAEHWATRESVALSRLVRGVLAAPKPGLDLIDEAVGELATSEYHSHHILAKYVSGWALFRLGDTAAARKRLREAITLAVRHGYTAIGQEARALLIASGGRIKELSGNPVDVLTASERRVAALAAAGVTNREIAKTLFVSLRTVEIHLSSTYRKLGVRSRKDLWTALGHQAAP